MAAFTSWTRPFAPKFCILGLLLLQVTLVGCKGDESRDYQREYVKREDCANFLRAQGATIEMKKYPRYGYGYMVQLSGVQVTDDTFQNLKCLELVADLDLSKSSITDEHMNQLVEMQHFARLDLSNTAVTDAGLEKLASIPMLLNLRLAGTRVTPAGVERFQKQHLANAEDKSNFKKTLVQLK